MPPIKRIGFLIIDLTPFYTGQMPVGLRDPNMVTIVKANNYMIRWAQKHGCAKRTYIAEYIDIKKDPTAILRPNEEQTIDEVFQLAAGMRQKANLIKKIDYSAFHLTDLGDRLEMDKVELLVVGGINSRGCVSEAVMDAVAKHGIAIALANDSHLDNLEGGGTHIPTPSELYENTNYRYLRRDRFYTGFSTHELMGLVAARHRGEAAYWAACERIHASRIDRTRNPHTGVGSNSLAI
jgi:nicotinamidase-related amidase